MSRYTERSQKSGDWAACGLTEILGITLSFLAVRSAFQLVLWAIVLRAMPACLENGDVFSFFR